MSDGAGGWTDGLKDNAPTSIVDAVLALEVMTYEVSQRNVIRLEYTSSLDLPANGSVELSLKTIDAGFSQNLGLTDANGVPLTSGVVQDYPCLVTDADDAVLALAD